MPEIKHEVKTYEVNYQCDECSKGNMIPINHHNDLVWREFIDHKCDHCGHICNFKKQYPYIKYEP